MAGELWGVHLLSLVFLSAALGYPYTYCQAPLPRAVEPPLGLPASALSQIVVFSRHGDRAPTRFIPSGEPNAWDDCDGNGWETNMLGLPGVSSHQKYSMGTTPFASRLGQALRQVYVDQFKFLPETLTLPLEPTLAVTSTDTPRTVQSVTSILAGLWPAEKRSARVSPIPIDTVPADVDPMIPPLYGPCHRLVQASRARTQMEDWQSRWWNLVKGPMGRAIRVMGTNGSKDWNELCNADRYLDQLAARWCHKMPTLCDHGTGECISPEDVEAIQQEADWQFGALVGTDELLRLSVSSAAESMVQAMLAGVPKYIHYSGHDTTVSAVLWGFLANMTDERWPPYASHIVFEVWNSRQVPYVRMVYNGEVRRLPECASEPCTLSELASIVKTRLATPDLAAECGAVNHQGLTSEFVRGG